MKQWKVVVLFIGIFVGGIMCGRMWADILEARKGRVEYAAAYHDMRIVKGNGEKWDITVLMEDLSMDHLHITIDSYGGPLTIFQDSRGIWHIEDQ